MTNELRTILNAGVRSLFFNGQYDLICNHVSSNAPASSAVVFHFACLCYLALTAPALEVTWPTVGDCIRPRFGDTSIDLIEMHTRHVPTWFRPNTRSVFPRPRRLRPRLENLWLQVGNQKALERLGGWKGVEEWESSRRGVWLSDGKGPDDNGHRRPIGYAKVRRWVCGGAVLCCAVL